jgi:Flp pilus assembly protein TadD
VCAIAIGACAHAAPAGPAAATRTAVERAEDAELHRDHATARARYEQAVASAPDAPSAIFARREYASTLEAWGEVPAAIAQLEAIVAVDPHNAPSWHDLGILRHAQGDDPGALVALRTAETLAPSDPRPRIALAALLWSTGDTHGAAAEYRALLGLELPDRVRAKVEWALQQLGPQ